MMIVWLYGLAVGAGGTAWLLSRPLLAHTLAPLAYGVYFWHVPVAWVWYFVTRSIPTQFEWWHEMTPIYPFPIEAYETLGVLVLCFVLSWIWDRYCNAAVLPMVMRLFRPIFRCCCPTKEVFAIWFADSGVEQIELVKPGDSNLAVLQHAILTVTGAELDPASSLHFVGLDSFGTSALIGLLRTQLPHARHLTVAKIYELGTVAKLARHLSADEHAEAVTLLDIGPDRDHLLI